MSPPSNCDFARAPSGLWTCKNCGYTLPVPLPAPPRRNCPAAKRAKPKSRGLGDTIAKITRAVGIKPCGGCKKRQKKLNELFPYQ